MPTLKELKESGQIPPRPDKLDKDQKEEWAAAGQVFTVDGVNFNPQGEHGPYWTVTADVDGLPVQFELQSHAGRDATMNALQSIIGSHGPVEGCVLVELSERAGNKFLVIDAVDTGETDAEEELGDE